MKRLIVLALVVLLMVGGTASTLAQDEKVTLRLASWQWDDPAYLPFWQGTTDAFAAANPNVTIEPFGFPIDQLWDRLNIEIAAGTPPDLIEVTGFNVFEYMNLGTLAPLNPCFEGTDIVDRVSGQDSYAVDADGTMYALNLSSRTLELWVNKTLFDEAGIAVPTNFDEFKAAAIALTDPSKEQYGLVLTNTAHSRFYESMLDMVVGYGGHWTKDGKPAFTEPEVVKGVQFFKDLFDAGVMPQGVDGAGSQYAYFSSGKVAMTFDGPWYWAVMVEQNPDMADSVEIYRMPTDTQRPTGGPNNLIGIAADSDHYDIACEYIKSIATAEWGQVWTNNTRTIDPVEGAVSETFLADNPWIAPFVDDAPNYAPVAAPGLEIYHGDMVTMISNELVQVLYDNKPVEEALADLQKDVEEYLADVE